MKALFVTLIGLVLPAAVLADEPKMAAADSPIVIGMSVVTLPHPFFTSLKDGAEQAAATLGAKIVIVNSQGSPTKQSDDVRSFAAQGVHGILLTPMNTDSLVSAIDAAVKAGIPVAAVGDKANTDKVLVQVCADDVQGGRATARFIIDKLGNKGSVIGLEGPPGSSAAIDRKAGFDEIMKKSNVKILASQTASWRRDVGYGVMASLIQKHPDFDAVWSANDDMIIGAISAMSDAHIDPASKVTVGFDALSDAFQLMKDGKLTATIDQFPGKQAGLAVEYLVGYIKNKTMPPKQVILITPELVTKAPSRPGL